MQSCKRVGDRVAGVSVDVVDNCVEALVSPLTNDDGWNSP